MDNGKQQGHYHDNNINNNNDDNNNKTTGEGGERGEEEGGEGKLLRVDGLESKALQEVLADLKIRVVRPVRLVIGEI